MMIKRINKIKNFGVFKDFKWDDTIPDFKKHNLFYGWNYTKIKKSELIFIWRFYKNGKRFFIA